MELVKVRMSEFKVTNYPNILITYGLGSCVGVVLFDKINKIAGMAHVMLPTPPNYKEIEISKYADTAIPAMIEEMEKLGAKKENLVAYLAGGANMFAFIKKSQTLQIGKKNRSACINLLSGIEIPIIQDETGGENGRTIRFDVGKGEFDINVIKRRSFE